MRIRGRDWKSWLHVKRSVMPGAGRGVFARKDISAGTILGNYHGRRVSTLREVYELRDDRFVFVVSGADRKPIWIDGNVPSNYLRFVNGARSAGQQELINIEAYQYGGSLNFRARRRILAGEELVLDYGAEYWDTYSNVDGIKHRNDVILRELQQEANNCTDVTVCAALHGMIWLVEQMSSVRAYYSFFGNYLWMFYEFRLSKGHPLIVDFATRLLRLELDGAQFRLEKMFEPTLEDKWRFISLLPILYEVQADDREYAKFYRSYFPRSIQYYDVSFEDCEYLSDFEGMVSVLMDYCFLEMARDVNQYSRQFRLPESRFSEYWKVIKQTDIRELESSATDFIGRFELDYQMTHLVMCRIGYGSKVLARKTAFDSRLADYLMRHEGRILKNRRDLDLMAELAYCYLEMGIQSAWVRMAIDKILASQHANGSWGPKSQMRLRMYDRMHATWTAVTALCFSTSNCRVSNKCSENSLRLEN